MAQKQSNKRVKITHRNILLLLFGFSEQFVAQYLLFFDIKFNSNPMPLGGFPVSIVTLGGGEGKGDIVRQTSF